MTEAPGCPECDAVVEPSWDWCQSCGWDPDGLKPDGWEPAVEAEPVHAGAAASAAGGVDSAYGYLPYAPEGPDPADEVEPEPAGLRRFMPRRPGGGASDGEAKRVGPMAAAAGVGAGVDDAAAVPVPTRPATPGSMSSLLPPITPEAAPAPPAQDPGRTRRIVVNVVLFVVVLVGLLYGGRYVLEEAGRERPLPGSVSTTSTTVGTPTADATP